jgi:hypothetical protein
VMPDPTNRVATTSWRPGSDDSVPASSVARRHFNARAALCRLVARLGPPAMSAFAPLSGAKRTQSIKNAADLGRGGHIVYRRGSARAWMIPTTLQARYVRPELQAQAGSVGRIVMLSSGREFDETCQTFDRDGEPRPPPGRGWIRCQSRNGSTSWQRRRSI